MEVYRLILRTPRPGISYPEGVSYDTGATYAGCAQNNTAPCDPQQFNTEQDAINYANSRGEIPVRVSSVEQTWEILEGRQPITDNMVIDSGFSLSSITGSPLLIGALAIGALLLLTKKRGAA